MLRFSRLCHALFAAVAELYFTHYTYEAPVVTVCAVIAFHDDSANQGKRYKFTYESSISFSLILTSRIKHFDNTHFTP